MRGLVRRFTVDEGGATAIEYALIGGLVSIAIIAGAIAVGSAVNSTLQGIATENFAPAG